MFIAYYRCDTCGILKQLEFDMPDISPHDVPRVIAPCGVNGCDGKQKRTNKP